MTETELQWLDYAWGVVNCSQEHQGRCVAAGAAVPGPGRVDGNELRWPGYLGRDYRSNQGILCVAAVHREPSPSREESRPVLRETNAALISSARRWLASGRSDESDSFYIESVRRAYEEGLPHWRRWRRHFRILVEKYLGLKISEIAWANLAKCRVPIDRGDAARRAEAKLTRICQVEFVPMSDLVDKIRPIAVLVSVLRAGRGGDIVTSWDGQHCSPRVYAWQGQSGHDRHNTHPEARPLHDWAPEMAADVRKAISQAKASE